MQAEGSVQEIFAAFLRTRQEDAIAGGPAGIYDQGKNSIPAQWVDRLQPGYELYLT